MGSESRDKLYEKIQKDIGFAKLICSDFNENTLISLIKPNKILEMKCSPFMKKGRITNKTAVINEITNHAKSNYTLSKIIMLTWLENNKATTKFIETNVTKAVIEELNSGKFGDYNKIKILSQIDNRQGVNLIFNKYFELNKPKEEIIETEIKENNKNENSKEITTLNNELQKALERIKTLENALEVVKQTNKEQKTQIELKTKEITSLSSKLSEKTQKSNELQNENLKLSNDITNLKTRLNYSEEENKKLNLLTKQKEQNNYSNLSLSYEKISNENEELKAVLAYRNSALKRFETENNELKQILKSSSDHGKTIENLREKLKQTENDSSLIPIAGQIADSNLFISVYGDPFSISNELIKDKKLINEEFVLLYIDSNNTPQKIVSLENEEKEEIFGTLKSDQGTFFIENEENRIQIFVPVTAKQIGKPTKGIILPEIANRPEGVYSIISLSDKSNEDNINTQKQKSTNINNIKHKNNEINIPTKQFNGENLLIIGGDRVGHEYERILSKYNLKITWRSGFESISDLRSGLSSYNAVIIIIKQLSHTLLREITSATKKDGIPIIYSSRRGISGVLAELQKHFTYI